MKSFVCLCVDGDSTLKILFLPNSTILQAILLPWGEVPARGFLPGNSSKEGSRYNGLIPVAKEGLYARGNF